MSKDSFLIEAELKDCFSLLVSHVLMLLHHCSPVIGSADSVWIPDAVNNEQKQKVHHGEQTQGLGRSSGAAVMMKAEGDRDPQTPRRRRSETRQALRWETQVSVILLGFLGQQDSNHKYVFWIITYRTLS